MIPVAAQALVSLATLVAPEGKFLGSGAAKSTVLIPIFVAFYVLPILLAWQRRSPRRWQIAMISLFLGWTGIGWVVAMVLNFAYLAPPEGTVDRPHVPGNVFDDTISE